MTTDRVSWEEILANMYDRKATKDEADCEPLQILIKKAEAKDATPLYLTAEQWMTILQVLEHRKNCILNASGIVREFLVYYKTGPMSDKLHQACERYGRVMP